MEDKIKDVYHLYRNESISGTRVREAVRELYRRYLKHREEPLLDSIAASAAVGTYFLTEQGSRLSTFSIPTYLWNPSESMHLSNWRGLSDPGWPASRLRSLRGLASIATRSQKQ